LNQTWLVTGGSGLLGHALCNYLNTEETAVFGASLTHSVGIKGVLDVNVDIRDNDAVQALFEEIRPDCVVHAAGLTNVDECEKQPDLAHQVHVLASENIARAAAQIGAQLVYISTDHLWDGSVSWIEEDTPPNPINIYAKTKLEGEHKILSYDVDALIVRTNFFGAGRPWRLSFSDWIINGLTRGEKMPMFGDVYFTPLSLDHLCIIILEMVQGCAEGIYNVCGADRLSKYDFCMQLAQKFELPKELVQESSIQDFEFAAPRPSDMSLSTKKLSTFLGRKLPSIDEGLETLAKIGQK